MTRFLSITPVIKLSKVAVVLMSRWLTEAEATYKVLYQPPVYMLVKLLHDPGMEISIPPLQPSVVPIKTVKFTHNRGHGRSVTLEQFPVTLAYAITDYKCQGKTFKSVIVDLNTPSGPGSSSPMSAYIQLSQATALNRISIIRPFNEKIYGSRSHRNLLRN
jgi:hypothetical protein